MAYGTATLKPVLKIFGPGNSYVVEAKRQSFGAVSIDLLPGPSEVLIMADKTGNPAFIAADFLAQAEHGKDSGAGFITDNEALLNQVLEQIEIQAEKLGARSGAHRAGQGRVRRAGAKHGCGLETGELTMRPSTWS